MSDVALIGLEVIKLGSYDDGSPWRMTVDAWQDGKMVRYQVAGQHYNGWPDGVPERTLEDLARVQTGSELRRNEIAIELDRLDREAAEKIAPIIEELRRAQVLVLHGRREAATVEPHVDNEGHAIHDA